MNILTILLKLLDKLLPLFTNTIIYFKGKKDKENEIDLENLKKSKNNNKKQIEKLKRMNDVEININELGIDDIYDRL
jgi:galactokinase/mevalonate kinase-like predicted kinase